ncbi:MAG: universal stress protein [Desulfurococcales archaeon]|nr:universal stress protein [Desulfurococcales archaeon]
MYRSILVGVDGSEASLRAAERAADLASHHGARIILLSVVPPPTVFLGELMTPEIIDPKPLVDAAKSALEKLAERLRKEKGVEVETHVVIGDPAESIVDIAKDFDVDLIVVGRRGLSGIERLFVGSVTRKVLERTDRDVLVVVK